MGAIETPGRTQPPPHVLKTGPAMFTLAHLSDPHLAPLPKPTARELMGKRFIGYCNWLRSRKAIHDRGVLDAIVKDLLAQSPDHIAVGGDLINLSLPREFENARTWLQSLGSPERVSVIPGNHDAYVPAGPKTGFDLWRAYMRTDAGRSKKLAAGPNGFPFVRRFEEVALIGLSSAVPTPPFTAWGRIDSPQLDALDRILSALGEEGYFRIVLIHHPPQPGATGWRSSLLAARDVSAVLMSRGAELVLYGHTHVHAINVLPGNAGSVPIVGAPSASSSRTDVQHQARYNLFRIWRDQKRWRCEMTGRGLPTRAGRVTEIERRLLTG